MSRVRVRRTCPDINAHGWGTLGRLIRSEGGVDFHVRLCTRCGGVMGVIRRTRGAS